MKKIPIQTDDAPKAVGPYSQGILLRGEGSLLFISGQIPLDLQTGKLIQGDIRQMTHCVIDHIEAILKKAGSSLDNVTKVELFLKNLQRDFAAVNEEYAKRFSGEIPPARQAVEVSSLPLGAEIEISCIAVVR